MLLELNAISIRGYRSIRSLKLPVRQFEYFVGKNGVGKSNLGKAVHLLQFAAQGTIVKKIAEEGGIESVIWSGEWDEDVEPSIHLAAELGDLAYVIDIGAPEIGDPNLNWKSRQTGKLTGEPVIKAEHLYDFSSGEAVAIMTRIGRNISLINANGQTVMLKNVVLSSETALHSIQDGFQFPQLESVRMTMDNWRFYHHFYTDRNAPMRRPSLPVCTPSLDAQGHNLSATIATLFEFEGRGETFVHVIKKVLKGCQLQTYSNATNRIDLSLHSADTLHNIKIQEISDGIIQFLCLASALLALRPPKFMVFNEPENGLHAEMLGPLAELLKFANKESQIWLFTHSPELVAELIENGFEPPQTVFMEKNNTLISKQGAE